jgi:hypothetical protein
MPETACGMALDIVSLRLKRLRTFKLFVSCLLCAWFKSSPMLVCVYVCVFF